MRPRAAGSRFRGRLLTALLSAALMTAPSLAAAGETATETSWEGGLGAAAALSTLVYGPVKLVYATGGLIVGAFAWAFTAGDTQVAEKVFTRSVRGTYVITPEHLTGEKELVFIGRHGDAQAAGTATVASAPPDWTTETRPSEEDEVYEEMGW